MEHTSTSVQPDYEEQIVIVDAGQYTQDQLKGLCIEQIMSMQSSYLFGGPRHTEESLSPFSLRKLESLCNVMVFAISYNLVSDRRQRQLL
jgi:hypothetical protein